MSGIGAPLAVTRVENELLYGVERAVRRRGAVRDDGHEPPAQVLSWPLGVEREIASSSSFMSAATSAKSGVLR